MVGRGTIDNFDNNGKVAGIKVDNATIKYMNNQKDIISSATDGVFLHAGTIDSFDNSGVITGNQNGIRLEKNGGHVSGTIKTLNNTGSIIGTNGYGINVVGSKDSFHTLNNQGYIYGKNSGIYVSGQWGIVGKISTIKNQGTIIGSQYGIHLVSFNGKLASTIENIFNEGTILGQISGIHLNAHNQYIDNHILLQGPNALIAGGKAGIHNKGTIGVNNNGTSVNNGNVIDLKNGATIASLKQEKDVLKYDESGTAILNEGTIKGNISLDKSFIYGSVHNKNTIGGNISLNNKSYISSINNEKNIQGSIDLKEQSHINSILNNGTIEKGISLDKSTIGSIENSGIIGNGGIKLDNESKIGSIENHSTLKVDLDHKSQVGSVINYKDTTIDLKNNSRVDILENKEGSITITKDETSYIGGLLNSGTIKNEFKNDDTMQAIINNNNAIMEQGLENTGSIAAINNAGTITGINNIFNDKTKDDIKKGTIGSIVNTGIIGNEASPLATQDITYGINNSGTIEKLINSSGDINNPNTDKDIHIYGGINNSGYIDIFNTGNIHGGITNSGTLILSNGHIHSGNGSTQASWHGGFIGKNNNGYHIENNDNGKVSIDGWYFNDLEYKGTTQEDIANRLENAIIVGGNNIGGISADKIYVNTSKLKLNTIYDANTFFIDENGKVIGDKINNNAGVNANNIHSLSGIYDFLGLGEGRYIANVNVSELSGKTLAKSMVYSARLRNINISNILRDTTAKNFQTEFSQVLDMELSKKGEAYGNDADLLAELEDIFIPNKNPNAKNHSFLIPYYNHSSIKIGNSVGQLSANTTGLIGGSLRELPNDYGTIGFYLGYEDASKEQATQRLKFDDKTYYGGLTYYGVLARDGIDQYYISASTRFDYTTTDIEKTYKNIPATIESDTQIYGYGIDVKVGANYYNTLEIARITPEIGLSYYGMSNKNFSLKHIDGLREHYLAEQFNFIDASAALKWYKPWSDKLRSNVTIGAIVNLYEDAKGNLRLGANHFTTEVQTSKYYGFGQLGLSYNIANNADLSLNYAGAFTFDNTTSHTMFLKLGLWW
ncbi:autotransporter outer membrane beta-barrel domain-containing protein [Campylobacter armoricus]|uniref:autotransporter outer membrane beta-barrel domain-containing protein n=3 Tax=Campylobacter armoricus TaxID=2505970 RepID=UPI00125F2CDC|nr:autotransporter outer membrane beta-barrel domain-containing protein [Campylobacter armoricus]